MMKKLMMILILNIWAEHTMAIGISQTNSSAKSFSLGGGGRASVSSVDVALFNPAILPHLRGRDIHTTRFGQDWSIGVMENAPDKIIPAALHYHRSKEISIDQGTIEHSELRLTLGQFISERVSFGVTGIQREARTFLRSWGENQIDLGVMMVPHPAVSIAAVWYDAYSNTQAEELALGMKRQSPQYALGINYLMSSISRVHLDSIFYTASSSEDFSGQTLHFGYEVSINRWMLFRLGAQQKKEESKEVLYSGGFGFDLPRFRLNYGYSPIRGEDSEVHSIDFGIAF